MTKVKNVIKRSFTAFCACTILSFSLFCNIQYKAKAELATDATIAAGCLAILACCTIAAGASYASKNDMQITDSRVWNYMGENAKDGIKQIASGMQQAGKSICTFTSGVWNDIKSGIKGFVDDYKTQDVDANGNLETKDVPTGVDAGFTNQTAVNTDQGQTWNWKNCPSSVFLQIIPGANGTYTKTVGKSAVQMIVDNSGSHLTITLSNGVVLSTSSGMYGGMNLLGNSQGYKYMCEYYIRGGADALHFISQAQIGGYDEWDEFDFGTWTISNYSGIPAGQIQYNKSNVLQIWVPGTTNYYNVGQANDYTGVENFLYKTLVDEQELPAPDFVISKANYDALSTPIADTATQTLAVPATESEVAQDIDVTQAVPADVIPDYLPTYDMDIPELIFTKKFPFSIPYDCFNAVKNLVAPATAPVWTFPFNINISGCNINKNITLDMTTVSPLVAVLRWGLSLIFIMGLIVVTRKLIGT